MTAITFILFAIIGAVARALVTNLEAPFNRQLWGTVTLNLAGSFVLGFLYGSSANAAVAIGVGGLGSLTTFSTYVAQVECVQREGKTSHAVLYLVGAAIAGVTMAWLGWTLA